MTTTNINALQQLFATTSQPPKSTTGSFYEALAEAWGSALDKQAEVIKEKSAVLNQDENNDTPKAMTELTAESAKISFMANSSHTSMSESAEALKAVAQK